LIEVLDEVWNNRKQIPGYRITYQPKFLRHFTCHFEIIE
jgi:tryptophanase